MSQDHTNIAIDCWFQMMMQSILCDMYLKMSTNVLGVKDRNAVVMVTVHVKNVRVLASEIRTRRPSQTQHLRWWQQTKCRQPMHRWRSAQQHHRSV